MNDQTDLVFKKQNFISWIHFLDRVDVLFKDRGYQKILTPHLVSSGAMEAQLEAFKTKFTFGQKIINFELPTSPEFSLKKALAAGFGDLFEVKTCFRNEESSAVHRAEFTMLEFYKTNIDLTSFIHLVLKLLKELGEGFLLSQNNQDGNFNLKYSSFPVVEISKISDLFLKHGLKLTPDTTLDEMRGNADRSGVEYNFSDSWDDLFFRIWIECIEPKFDPKVLTVVYDYPPSQAALAQINTAGWAARFEIYWNGFELGNAFHELGDAKAIELRWLEENKKREMQGKAPHPIDREFLSSLIHLPQSCGIAIGLERLFMAFTGLKSIGDFKFFETHSTFHG